MQRRDRNIIIYDAETLKAKAAALTVFESSYTGCFQSVDADDTYVYFLLSPYGSGQPRNIERWLRDNMIDVGLQTQYPGITDEEFDFLEVARFPYVALVSPAHPLATRAAIAAADLADETIITYGQDKPITRCIEHALARTGVSPRDIFNAGQVDATPMAVANGAVALVSANMRDTYPGLVAVNIADETMRASLGYAI